MNYITEVTVETRNFKAKLWRLRVVIEPRYPQDVSSVADWEPVTRRAREVLLLVARARAVHRKLFGRNPL